MGISVYILAKVFKALFCLRILWMEISPCALPPGAPEPMAEQALPELKKSRLNFGRLLLLFWVIL